jgi:hypothetical protein
VTLTGPTPILDAVYRRDAAGLARLLGAGPPPHLTAFEGDAETVQTLLAHGATDARTGDGKTALAIAQERGHAAIARRLRGELP